MPYCAEHALIPCFYSLRPGSGRCSGTAESAGWPWPEEDQGLRCGNWRFKGKEWRTSARP